MLLSVYMSNERNAMADLFKNTMNAMPNKKSIILIIPSAYSRSEFSKNFCAVINEDISESNNKREQIFRYYKFIKQVKRLQKIYNINHIFFESDMSRLCILFKFFIRNVKFSFCLHDPILHEGTSSVGYVERYFFNIVFPRCCHKIILTYAEAFDILHKNWFYRGLDSKFRYFRLPQMPELEYKELKDRNEDIKYDFLFFGRIEKYKGLDILTQVFKSDEMKKFKLLVVGRGRDEVHVQTLCSGAKNIKFINEYVSNFELASYIKQSKFVVLPYKSATGSQTVQIANYYGKMVIATEVGCFKEYIVEGKNGFFIKNFSYEGIKKSLLYFSKINLEKYKQSIQQEYKKFNINDFSEQLYNEIAK